MVCIDMPMPDCCGECQFIRNASIGDTLYYECVVKKRIIGIDLNANKTRATWCPLVDTADDKENYHAPCCGTTFKDLHMAISALIMLPKTYNIDETHQIIFNEDIGFHGPSHGLYCILSAWNGHVVIPAVIGSFEFIIKDGEAFCEVTVKFTNAWNDSDKHIRQFPIDTPLDDVVDKLFDGFPDASYLHDDFAIIFEGLKHLNFN